MVTLDAKVPDGPIADKWDDHKFSVKLVNPANKRKFDIIVVGTGLAGASAAGSGPASAMPPTDAAHGGRSPAGIRHAPTLAELSFLGAQVVWS